MENTSDVPLKPSAQFGEVSLTLVPHPYGVGNVVSYVYGPFIGLQQDGWGTVLLRPQQALDLAAWIAAHRNEIETLTTKANENGT